MELDPVFLSRLQFAFVITFHIIFPAFTLGLAAWLASQKFGLIVNEGGEERSCGWGTKLP
jgi:cytochrome bd-type quinol oxidase subunit 1